MTIEEAIERNQTTRDELWNEGFPTRARAIQLGIEGLKRLRDNRRDPEFDHYILLPGETED